MLWVASVTALTLLIIAGLLHSSCRALGAVRAIMSPDRGTGVATARTPPSSPNPTSISAPGWPTAIAAANRRSCRHADHDRNRGGREGRYPLSLCLCLCLFHVAPAMFAPLLGVPSTTGRAIMYLAHRPKPMRREVTPRRLRARSYVLGEMPADSAFASTSPAACSPAASSVRSKVAAMSIFFGLGASPWPDDLGAVRSGWGPC